MTRNRHFVFRESVLRQTRLLRLQSLVVAVCAVSISVCLLCADLVHAAKPIGLFLFLILLVTVAEMRVATNRINSYFI